jgi:hypothetical protein
MEMSDGTLFPAKVSIRGKNVFVNGHVFYIHNVAGDGDCLFHCFNESDNSNEKKGANFYRRITNTPEGEWGNHESIYKYVSLFKKNVCVVIPGKSNSFVEVYTYKRRNSTIANDEIVLLFRYNHFDLLKRE